MGTTVSVKELTLESFANYGTFANMLNPAALKIGAEPIEFFRDMVLLNLGSATAGAFSVCRVLPRPLVIDVTECHTYCGELNLPLDGDILIHVGLATPNGMTPLDQFEVFRVPRGTAVSIRPGVWHHAPFALGTEPVNTLIVLPERTYANDCKVVEIAKKQRTNIKI